MHGRGAIGTGKELREVRSHTDGGYGHGNLMHGHPKCMNNKEREVRFETPV